MSYAFHTLLKDKEIIAAEVMNEYNNGVRPRSFFPAHAN
jgi:hypothetical protein